MNNSTPNMSEQLVLYIDGALAGADKQAVENWLATNEAARAEYNSLLQTREAVKLYGLRQKVSSIHKEMMTELQPPVKKMNSGRRIFRYTMAAAASLILLVGGYMVYNFFTLTPDKVYSANYHTYSLSNERGVNDPEPTAGEKAYAAKNYAEVIKLHDAAASKTTKEEFLCGAAAMELGDDPKAIKCFTEVIRLNKENNQLILNDEAEYYLALSYIRNKDYDFALPLLETIRDDKEHKYNSEVSTRLIRKVKMLKWR